MAGAGYLVLQGGAEFGGQMKVSDLRALELAGGMQSPVCIVPAAAAPDDNHERAGNNGLSWFKGLGGRDVSVAGIIDHESANDTDIAEHIHQAGLIYLLGGFPAYLADVLKESVCWRAMQTALNRGAVLAGSSAGAMVLCETLFDPQSGTMIKGLGMLPNCWILPHYNTFGQEWAPRLQKKVPRTTLIGIDEHTGMINDGPQGCWQVYGPGKVTIYRYKELERHKAGSCFSI